MFAEFLMRIGIRHERTIPETPQQNGVTERMNRTLVEKARTMLIDAILSPDLWAEAVGTANYLRNRCPTKALRKVTPEEAWSG
ncbi:Retrovirus-related Pol polyprotein from transposon TNT 1-94, partial [Trichinella britovi]